MGFSHRVTVWSSRDALPWFEDSIRWNRSWIQANPESNHFVRRHLLRDRYPGGSDESVVTGFACRYMGLHCDSQGGTNVGIPELTSIKITSTPGNWLLTHITSTVTMTVLDSEVELDCQRAQNTPPRIVQDRARSPRIAEIDGGQRGDDGFIHESCIAPALTRMYHLALHPSRSQPDFEFLSGNLPGRRVAGGYTSDRKIHVATESRQ